MLDTATGQVLQRLDLNTSEHVSASHLYTIVATRGGKHAFGNRWNASPVAELDWQRGKFTRWISLRAPSRNLRWLFTCNSAFRVRSES